ncbi:hypothetical protein OROMI_026124 [Orobanche minor]
MVFLFEFALGYALFDAHGVNQLPQITTYKMAEEYLDNDPFKLIAYYPFSSPGEAALFQMKAILNSAVTKELKSFLVSKLPKRIPGASLGYQLAVSDGLLAHNIFEATEINVISGALITQVIRGLRMKIDKLVVGLEAPRLDKGPTEFGMLLPQSPVLPTVHHSVTAADKVVVVPHKFQGLFITKGLGQKDVICTRNLVPGKVLHGDKLISVQTEDDKTEVEYRVWNPPKSKLTVQY